jgi:hypothetical protein
MKKLKMLRLSPALIVAVIAVVLAIGGTATAALGGKDKKKVTSIADREVTKQAPGIADQQITKRAPGLSVANAASLGGVAAAGYQKGGGHTVNATLGAGASSTNNQVLDVPGIGQLMFDCAANGLASTPKLHNSSGVTLAAVGQTQIGSTASQDPSTIVFNDGDTLGLTARMSGATTVQLWNATSGKTATITFASSFCSYTASAVTNQ